MEFIDELIIHYSWLLFSQSHFFHQIVLFSALFLKINDDDWKKLGSSLWGSLCVAGGKVRTSMTDGCVCFDVCTIQISLNFSYFVAPASHETIWKGVPKFLRRVDTVL